MDPIVYIGPSATRQNSTKTLTLYTRYRYQLSIMSKFSTYNIAAVSLVLYFDLIKRRLFLEMFFSSNFSINGLPIVWSCQALAILWRPVSSLVQFSLTEKRYLILNNFFRLWFLCIWSVVYVYGSFAYLIVFLLGIYCFNFFSLIGLSQLVPTSSGLAWIDLH